MPRRSVRAGSEAYVEAELDVPDGFFDEDDVDGARGAAAGGRGRSRHRAPRLRRRAHARIRVGPSGRARGRRGGGGAADRHVGSVRAAAACASVLPARRPRRVLRGGAARPAPRCARRMGARSSQRGGATTSSRVTRMQSHSGSQSCRRSSRRPRAWLPTRRRACSPSASGSGMSRSSPRRRAQPSRRSRPTKARARRRWRRWPSGRSPRSSASRPSSARVPRSCASSPCGCGEAGSDLHRFLATLDAEPGALESGRGAPPGRSPTSSAASEPRPTTSFSSWPRRGS